MNTNELYVEFKERGHPIMEVDCSVEIRETSDGCLWIDLINIVEHRNVSITVPIDPYILKEYRKPNKG